MAAPVEGGGSSRSQPQKQHLCGPQRQHHLLFGLQCAHWTLRGALVVTKGAQA